MKFFETLAESVVVLKSNKLRSLLSILGIVIGIGSVITLITLGKSSQKSVEQQIESLGSNLLVISPGFTRDGYLRSASGNSSTLTNEDAQAIIDSKQITTIDKTAMEYSSRAQVSYGSKNTNAQISGVSSDYFEIRNIQLQSGRLITDQDTALLSKIAIIGSSIRDDFFSNNEDPINQYIRINGDRYRIIGVTKTKGASGGMGGDEIVYVPLLTAQKIIFGTNYLSNIYVRAMDKKLMDAAENQIGLFMLQRHNKSSVDQADFRIMSQADILDTVNRVTDTFTTLLGGIAAISLVVGGIGIMNIMLVTVTERTREIGIRKALGAKRRYIIRQFLIEAVILTFLGGFIGIMLGILSAYIITKIMSLPYTYSLPSIFLSFLVAAVIGIVFGLYPALKASKLQPVEALRYE